ncbi:MAG: hypothetical protein ACI8TQ_001028 [Planctomycetota bacterium]|jgi:hypothetical protein
MSEENTEPESEAAAKPTASLRKESIWEVYFPRNVNADVEAVPVASFPMIIYFWPSMIGLLVCGLLQSLGGFEDTTLGLVAVAIWTFNLLVIVTDLDQKKFVISILVMLLVGFGLWVANLKEMTVMDSVTGWVGGLDVRFSTQAYLIMGSILLILFLVGMIQPRFDYWRFESNEFVHYVQPWGRDQSIPRMGSTVTREVPDMLELILTFGGGTLLIRREGQVVARIEHVPFLSRRMVAIERLLGATRVRNVSGS